MSSLDPEQLSASQKAGFDTIFGIAARTFEGFEKLVALNAQTVRTTIAENQELAGKVVLARDPQEFFALQTGHMQASAERMQAYWRDVYEIMTGAQGVLASVAEAQFRKSQQDAQSYVDSLARNAPAGSEAVVSAWKSAIGAAAESANSAYEAAKKAAKQVVEVAESNASAASKGVAQQLSAVGKAASSSKK
ncbi:granule-associated protein [Caballeronia glathei]|uniref:Phasin (PHA-granule associated protein) n=1 Tax=Caballeronia glathei TaxID=60547 RepID=A0A069PS01_9BURK|nr:MULTISPECIES: phasin family protein [Burkholderiaceae]KDR43192.1 Phasin (PHA-granule associated protein) [Caballeronia glathei]TCK39603.1 phasin family protein [Paraburkholderia sp. BL8N3]CDY79279.1 granule-associated protein [Caballeronia glathei]